MKATPLAAISFMLLLSVACSRGEPAASSLTPGDALAAPGDPTAFGGGYPRYQDQATGIRIILGTPDLGVGRHRVGFVLSDESGLLRLPIARVSSYYAPSGVDGPRDGPVEAAVARFFEFPYGVRGMYSVELTFDRPGDWVLEVRLPRPDGSAALLSFAFPVPDRTVAPAVGEAAPRSGNRTALDVASLDQLTTGSEPDAALYRLSVEQALEQGRPLVLVFASPAFCTNALCGPQVEVLSDLAARYGDRANFIHIDLYENPHEIHGDLDRAVRTPLLAEWGLETDEWTFVIDERGVVVARFEAFVTTDELEQALQRVLLDGVARGG